MPVPEGWRKTWELMRAAKSKRMASAGEKLMLMMLVDYCNDAGQCWETQESLALDCCMSLRAAGEHIRALVEVGAIESMQRRRSGLPAIITLDIVRIMSGNQHEFRPAKSADQDRQNLPIKTGKICRSGGAKQAKSADQDRQNLPVYIDTPNTPLNTQDGTGASARPAIPLPQRLCLQLSAALRINAQPTTSVSSTHPAMLALVKAIPVEWEDTALAMAPEVVRELVADGKAGAGLYAYTLAVLKTRMERAVSQSQQALEPSGAPVASRPYQQRPHKNAGIAAALYLDHLE